MTMPSVKRILRLRSAVRNDEMKAESTLPPAQPSTCRGVPIGAGSTSVWLSLARSVHGFAGMPTTSDVACQTVYESNSWQPGHFPPPLRPLAKLRHPIGVTTPARSFRIEAYSRSNCLHHLTNDWGLSWRALMTTPG